MLLQLYLIDNYAMEKNEYLESVEMNTGVEMIPCESSNIEGFGIDKSRSALYFMYKIYMIWSAM